MYLEGRVCGEKLWMMVASVPVFSRSLGHSLVLSLPSSLSSCELFHTVQQQPQVPRPIPGLELSNSPNTRLQ